MKRKKKTRRKPTTRTAKRIVMLTAEVQRLTEKCKERSNECYLLKVQKDALEMKLVTLRQAYNRFDSEFVEAIRK